MKKLVILLLAVMMTVALAACGSSPAPAEQPSAPAPAAEESAPPAEEAEQAAPADTGAELDLSDYLHTRTGQFYSQFQDGRMYMKYETEYEGQSSTIITATDGEKTYSETVSNGMSSKVIMDGEYMYTIDDSSKTVYKMSLQMAGPQAMMDAMVEEGDVDIADLKTGVRDIDGKTYDTEEWSMDGASSLLCFDGADLAYIIGTYEGMESVMKVVEFSAQVDASLFELPSDYQMMAI